MPEIKKILACVDLSQFSGPILDYAAETAWRDGSEIMVLNIINQRDIDHVEDVATTIFSVLGRKISLPFNILRKRQSAVLKSCRSW